MLVEALVDPIAPRLRVFHEHVDEERHRADCEDQSEKSRNYPARIVHGGPVARPTCLIVACTGILIDEA